MMNTDTADAARAVSFRDVGDGRVLRGQAGGGGAVTGPACIVHSAVDLAQVGPGDIAVVEVADAAWVTRVGDAAGLVAERGGILSNGAIVARERGLVVVVAVADATSLIQDGQLLRIDGATGVVELSNEP